MYGRWGYKKTWERKLNLYLGISEMPSFVFLCVRASALTLTLTPHPQGYSEYSHRKHGEKKRSMKQKLHHHFEIIVIFYHSLLVGF
jgi:hypothetical protein